MPELLRGSYFGSMKSGVSKLEVDPTYIDHCCKCKSNHDDASPAQPREIHVSSGSPLPGIDHVVAVPLIWAQKNAASPAGVAWGVKGTWRVEGKDAPIHTGDSIQPGSLLRPDPVAAQHTIIVLLPDGQRVFYECFTTDDCARGFRVPSLYRDPEPFAVDMLARIGAALIREDRDFSAVIGHSSSIWIAAR